MSRPEIGLVRGSSVPLARRYDVALLDLDGVVYVGARAVPGVPTALATARGDGMRLAFVTNNASRTPRAVAAHLVELGVPADVVDVVTSAQAAARHLAEHLAPGAAVLVLGTDGLREAIAARGLRPVDTADGRPAAVVQGYSPDLGWRALAEAAIAIGQGAAWVATNADATLPSERGPVPGNGSLVAALRHATGSEPVVVGKPHPTMHAESILRSGASRPLVVGDRLDTDIEGANASGCDSLLVLSGTTDPTLLLSAPPHHRPTYVSRDASGLRHTHPRARSDGHRIRCGRWDAYLADGVFHLASRPEHSVAACESIDADLDALRALCVQAWSHDVVGSEISPDDEGAAQTLERLGLVTNDAAWGAVITGDLI